MWPWGMLIPLHMCRSNCVFPCISFFNDTETKCVTGMPNSDILSERCRGAVDNSRGIIPWTAKIQSCFLSNPRPSNSYPLVLVLASIRWARILWRWSRDCNDITRPLYGRHKTSDIINYACRQMFRVHVCLDELDFVLIKGARYSKLTEQPLIQQIPAFTFWISVKKDSAHVSTDKSWE